MSGIVIRLLVIIGLVVGAAAHGSIAGSLAMDRDVAAGMDPDCDMSGHGKMKPADCAAICGVASADIARVASLRHPLVRPAWRLADLSADGLEPSPDPTPPRA